MIGGIYCSLPACVNSGCQITLTVRPEQSLSQYIGLFSAPAALAICTQRQGYDLICLSLCVFILLSLLCSLCAPSTSLPLFHHRFGPSLIRYPTFGLRSFNKVAIWAGMASCSWWFQEDRRTLQMLWLANIVWAFSWVKLLRESR